MTNLPDARPMKISTEFARTTATWQVDATITALPELASVAANKLPRFRVVGKTEDSVTISCRMSWRSWGGWLTLTFFEDSPGSRVEAKWVPSVPTTLTDWGQGNDDIRRMFAALEQSIASNR